MKHFNIMHNVGSSKYVVNYHDGLKTHKDGSEFYDIAIFDNKRKMNLFTEELVMRGYKQI